MRPSACFDRSALRGPAFRRKPARHHLLSPTPLVAVIQAREAIHNLLPRTLIAYKMVNYMPYSGSYASGSSYVTGQPDEERDPHIHFARAGQTYAYGDNAWFGTAPSTSTYQSHISSSSSLAGALDEGASKSRPQSAEVWPENEARPMVPLSYVQQETASAQDYMSVDYSRYEDYSRSCEYPELNCGGHSFRVSRGRPGYGRRRLLLLDVRHGRRCLVHKRERAELSQWPARPDGYHPLTRSKCRFDFKLCFARTDHA